MSGDDQSADSDLTPQGDSSSNTELRPQVPETTSGPREEKSQFRTIANDGDSADSLFGKPLISGQVVLDRFEVIEQLGRGGFGAVYSAMDRSLNRMVAIKQSRGLRSFFAGQVRNEARAIASLNHPNIVQIHDLVPVDEDDEWLIVMECLSGQPLSRRMNQSRMTIVEAVKIGVEIVGALMHAHEKKLVHSDLKPANLFLCDTGLVKLLDFGLAVAYFPEGKGERIGGTPGYMSPEQIRGESHLIDGRTDIWAFGVVIYEMLTGSKPFSARDAHTTNARTLFKLAPPPRQLNPGIDNELQRIVLKCLKPLISERYPSTAELREDLVHWLETQGESATGFVHLASNEQKVPDRDSSVMRIGKRGLQPFTELDAAAYLSLIPGPRDRNGIPDSIQFWKRWVESDDPGTEYPVGVLYGPSGSGKTSYVRAGLFKQLGPDVCHVYLECRPGDLATRLTRVIETQLNHESSDSSLRDLLLRLRSGDSSQRGYRKLLIVLDQFESWAHAATLDERMDLADSLRQCDGVQLRALVVTRDDYWMGAKELLHWLEVPMQEGRNVASVDLLDPPHAEEILEAIGREAETLPANNEALTKEQRQFITQAVQEMTLDGSIICVHLVMFAQMMKLQKWTPRALRENGGVVGACSLFFQELFGKSGRHSPEYQRLAPLCRAILQELLPEGSETAHEVCRDRDALIAVAEQAGHGQLLDDCLRLMCEELRIVSVVGPDWTGSANDESAETEDRFRLAHDFLIEPVNQFLTRTQEGSWRGRTMSRLSEMSEVWTRRPSRVYLPSFVEYLLLLTGSRFQRREEKESRFLVAATRLHAGRIAVAVVGLLGFLFLSAFAFSQWQNAHDSRQNALNSSVARLLDLPADKFELQVGNVRRFGVDANKEVAAWVDSKNVDAKLRSRVFLKSNSGSEDFSAITELLSEAPPEFFSLILQIASQSPDAEQALLATAAEGNSANANRAAILLAYLGNPSQAIQRMTSDTDAQIVQGLLNELLTWRGSPEVWADLLQNAEDDEVKYQAGVALGGYSESELQSVRSQIDLNELINSPKVMLHSLGRFLGRQIGEDEFSIALNPPDDADWTVELGQIPMVKFDPATLDYVRPNPATRQRDKGGTITVKRPFLISTIPVNRDMYARFVSSNTKMPDDTGIDLETRWKIPRVLLAKGTEPAVGTSQTQAFMFCNWLSQQEGLEECYVYNPKPTIPSERNKFTLQPINWDWRAESNGYRLPTKSEYQLATQCNYTSGIPWGHAEPIARKAGNKMEDFIQPTHTMIPNRLGLFLCDVRSSTWVSPEEGERETELGLSKAGFVPGIMTAQLSFPGTLVYLTRNAE